MAKPVGLKKGRKYAVQLKNEFEVVAAIHLELEPEQHPELGAIISTPSWTEALRVAEQIRAKAREEQVSLIL